MIGNTMAAIVLTDFGGVENFRLENVSMPLRMADQLLVQIKAVSFNPVDYQIRKGLGEKKLLHSPVLGREFAGIVLDNGGQGSPFKKGDAVFAYVGSMGSNGTYAEYISVPSRIVALKPTNMSFEQAASLPLVGLTAMQCFERLQIPRERSVFVAGGSGGVGTMLLKLLLASGVHKLVTTAGNEESRDALLRLGLEEHQILNYHAPDIVQRARELNNGELFDYCIDIVGGTLSEVCSDLLTINGVYADVAFLGTSLSREVLFDRGATVYNISNYAPALSEDRKALRFYGRKLKQLAAWIEQERISAPELLHVGEFSVETVQKAHTLLETNRAKGRKLVMTI